MKLTRNYVLKIYGNFGKIEDLRYSASRYKLYTAAINIARKGQEKLAWLNRLTDKVPVNTDSKEKV